MRTLALVRHRQSGELYVLRQADDGHTEEITGPYYEPDYHIGELWSLGVLAIHHITSADLGVDDLAWADREQFLHVADLRPWDRVVN